MSMKKTAMGQFKAQDFQDLALVESIKRGNQAAFELLYKKYYPHMHRRIFLSLRNKQDAEDVSSEIFQKIYENIHCYEKKYTFNAWISRLAKNHMIDFVRKNNRNANMIAFSLDESIEADNGNEVLSMLEFLPVTISDNMFEHGMVPNESAERVAKLKVIYKAIESFTDRAVESLPETTRYIFKRFQFESKTPFEIAEEMTVDLKYVEEHIAKGYKSFDRALLEQRIMRLYLNEMPQEQIAKNCNLTLANVKLMVMRLKERMVGSINQRAALIEVSSNYSLEKLTSEDWFKSLNSETV